MIETELMEWRQLGTKTHRGRQSDERERDGGRQREEGSELEPMGGKGRGREEWKRRGRGRGRGKGRKE